ncbi:MAG: hypothetical protein DHS20C15_07400 [Planctomycetota bacterium]|nr:MAG: hypothetical protein DHS20C15_07400 [Planctomycetota bacterium]
MFAIRETRGGARVEASELGAGLRCALEQLDVLRSLAVVGEHESRVATRRKRFVEQDRAFEQPSALLTPLPRLMQARDLLQPTLRERGKLQLGRHKCVLFSSPDARTQPPDISRLL